VKLIVNNTLSSSEKLRLMQRRMFRFKTPIRLIVKKNLIDNKS